MSVGPAHSRCPGSGKIMPSGTPMRIDCERCGRTITVTVSPLNGVTRMVALHKPTAPINDRSRAAKEKRTAKSGGRGPGRPPKPVERETVTYVCYACRGHRYVVLPVQRGQIALPKPCPTCAGSGTVSVQSQRIEMIRDRAPKEM